MLDDVKTAVETGKLKKIEGIVQETVDEGVPAAEILDAMIATMGVVGDKFQRNEIFVPVMLVASLTMKKGVSVIQPLLAGEGGPKHGKFIIGTVAGDLHDIGKNLVALMVESAGFEVIDLGVDVPADKFVEAIINAGLQSQVKIMVGGAPITPEFAAEIGADAYTPDAGSAATKAVELAG